MSKIAEAFDGATFDIKRDADRLKVQLDHVRSHMLSGGWHTLEEIAAAIGQRAGTQPPTASISARLRDLRKPQFGGYAIDKRIREGHKGLWEYHLGAVS